MSTKVDYTVRGCDLPKLHKNSKKSGDGLPINPWVSDEKDSGTSFEIINSIIIYFGSLPYNGEYVHFGCLACFS